MVNRASGRPHQRRRLLRILMNRIIATKDANETQALKTKARRSGMPRKMRDDVVKTIKNITRTSKLSITGLPDIFVPPTDKRPAVHYYLRKLRPVTFIDPNGKVTAGRARLKVGLYAG